MPSILLTTVALSALLSQVPGVSAALYDTVIHTKYGPVQGYPAFNSSPISVNLSNWKDITVWKGIPFAASTGGQNRWKAPQPAKSWNDTLDAREFGNICPSSTSGAAGYTVDEDCLNLNIWSAAKNPNAKLPVVMWSYPAYSTAAMPTFNGGGMADKGVIYVNYNYRTGPLGWMAHPDLSREFEAVTGHNSSGNWGMLDQFAALRWIHENIAAFGGDPHHITVMGQSAGSAATQHIVNSPLTKGLIVGAIIESGVRDPHDPLCAEVAENYRTLDWAVNQGVKYLASKNVSSIAQARKLPMNDLVEPSQFSLGSSADWVFTATLDYYAIPYTYENTLRKGAANDVPIITGNARDENDAVYGLNITVSQYLENLNSTFGAKFGQKFLALYPATTGAEASAAQNLQYTERSKIGTWRWANQWRESAKSPVWTYLWDHAPPGQNQGAFHMSEIPYVLNNLYGVDAYPWTEEDYHIAATMNAYWVNFIKTGNPNGKGLVQWDRNDLQDLNTQELGGGWGKMRLGSKSRLELFAEWFKTLPAY
ncbi:carboxylesterase/lipase family protein [Aspergillus melleus]|uniref:carboxylesterase/lipase family protein n=1 Tax=Aspergillus melleus TaxID=138277 RepID=UPI001E8E57D2|nr:uncharacterized protein LDX57_012828 [Aspergillus melleus]KAH8435199.1 hypothetical protein LDX57_012828 [Aspergillus melleus]